MIGKARDVQSQTNIRTLFLTYLNGASVAIGKTDGLKTIARRAGKDMNAAAPWQAWRAPSWEEIAAAEAKEITQNKQP